MGIRVGTMSLHRDLLVQARFLVTKEPRRPSQASLRRGISASYYALFHLLVNEAVTRMIAGKGRDALRNCLRRAFDHGNMKKVAQQFAQENVSPKLSPGLDSQPLPPELIRVAAAFFDLQQARHEADYDLSRRFSRREALSFVGDAEQAFDDWKEVRHMVQTHTFLAGLLALGNMRT